MEEYFSGGKLVLNSDILKYFAVEHWSTVNKIQTITLTHLKKKSKNLFKKPLKIKNENLNRITVNKKLVA